MSRRQPQRLGPLLAHLTHSGPSVLRRKKADLVHPGTLNRQPSWRHFAATGLLTLGCPVEPGASGAPLLISAEGTWRVAGIVIGRTETSTKIGSLALPADALP